MKRLLVLFAAVTLAVLAAGWLAWSPSGHQPVQIIPPEAFDARIDALARRDTPSSSGLWHDPDFAALSGMGETSVAYAIAYLGCGCRSSEQQNAAISAMYLLPLPHYTKFLRQLATLHDRHAVSPHALARAVQVPDAYATAMQKAYTDPDVRGALRDIAARPDMAQSVKESIDKLLAGETWSHTKAFCRDRLFEQEPDCRTIRWWELL